ncbi:CDP-diacylglycerol--glycerol-3-phosphate 3-phosphatidyltransferase [Tulasnella sp. JGI-2019a]|nr:CDP-diacylglycerol--glycerol-3-phosphate 3-phosphatidyltransferase [Tulasnella sp. JGI-2019a]
MNRQRYGFLWLWSAQLALVHGSAYSKAIKGWPLHKARSPRFSLALFSDSCKQMRLVQFLRRLHLLIPNYVHTCGPRRYTHGHVLHNPAASTTSELRAAFSKKLPSFRCAGSAVTVCQHPKEFYTTLLAMIKRAKRRIVLSSLYIGTEEAELVQTLHTALAVNPALTLSLHLDLLRSTRPESPSTAAFLLPLIRSFGEERVKIYLFRTPKLKGLMAQMVPRRFDEGWGTWHAKIYAADDEVIVSGANLNTSYFTNRQDRYLHFRSQPGLTNYMIDYTQAMVPFAHLLSPADSSSDSYNLLWTNQAAGPTSFEFQAQKALTGLQNRYKELTTNNPVEDDGLDTTLFPVIQSGVLGMRQEEETIETLFDSLSESQIPATVDLTSGYFGLHGPYKSKIISSPEHVQWRVVAAGPKANGFYGSSGISGRIPEAYTWFERRFWKAALKAGKISAGPDSTIQLNEWERANWTYHAKGIWVRFGDRGSLPTISMFGSTNLNGRSARLDTELSFLMLTSSPELSRALADEADNIREHATQVDTSTWEAPERRVRWTTKAMAQAIVGML